ncbi:formate dehydrogenase subunit delta [Marinobacter salarius]
MSSDQLTNLIKMINQISLSAPTKGHDEKVKFVSQHLKKFWARDMKRQIIGYVDASGKGLSSVSLEAVRKL